VATITNALAPGHIIFRCSATPWSQAGDADVFSPAIPLFPSIRFPISLTDREGADRLVSSFDLGQHPADWAVCYRFNIVLRGRHATPMETK